MSMQKRCILPHPCNGPLYKDWTETDFFLKMLEEFDEVGKAYAKLRAAEREGLPKGEGTKRWWKLMDYVNHHNARRDHGLRFRKGEGNDGE